MAYGTQSTQGNKFQPRSNSGATTEAPAQRVSTAIFRSGLFASDPQNEMSAKLGEIASVKTKEDVTIPAGSYISLRTSKSGKTAFVLVVNPGKKKA